MKIRMGRAFQSHEVVQEQSKDGTDGQLGGMQCPHTIKVNGPQ